MSSDSVLDVGVALVWRDDQLLITRRTKGVHLAGMWEFPGGKCVPGESLAECAEREVAEELGITVTAERPRAVIQFIYPERHVRLHPFDCRYRSGEPQAIGCAEWRWVTRGELSQFEFPPADIGLVEELIAEATD